MICLFSGPIKCLTHQQQSWQANTSSSNVREEFHTLSVRSKHFSSNLETFPSSLFPLFILSFGNRATRVSLIVIGVIRDWLDQQPVSCVCLTFPETREHPVFRAFFSVRKEQWGSESINLFQLDSKHVNWLRYSPISQQEKQDIWQHAASHGCTKSSAATDFLEKAHLLDLHTFLSDCLPGKVN